MKINSRVLNSCIVSVIFILFAQVSIATPPAGYLKTASGLQYKIIAGKGVAKAKPGEIIKFRLRYVLAEKDSILQSSFTHLPSYAKVDTGAQVIYSFMEIVPKMSAGDSAVVLISIDSMLSKHIIAGYTPVLQKGKSLKAEIKLLKIFAGDSLVTADYTKEMDAEKNIELKELQTYMSQHSMSGMQVGDGVFVMIENAGDTTMKANAGTTASIKYKGYLLNGKVFDTNIDSSKGHTDPISVNIGAKQVILGWEEALPYFGKGGKGKILIPALLGYGPQPMGEDIPAYSNLIFDIEIIDVTKQDASGGN